MRPTLDPISPDPLLPIEPPLPPDWRPPMSRYDHATGPGPLNPCWQLPEPAAPRRPAWATPPDAEHERLGALEAGLERLAGSLRDDLRATPDGPFVVARADIEQLNAALAEVQAANAPLPHHRRSPAVAAWPRPVLHPGVLHHPRDLLRLIGEALIVLAAAHGHRTCRQGLER